MEGGGRDEAALVYNILQAESGATEWSDSLMKWTIIEHPISHGNDTVFKPVFWQSGFMQLIFNGYINSILGGSIFFTVIH